MLILLLHSQHLGQICHPQFLGIFNGCHGIYSFQMNRSYLLQDATCGVHFLFHEDPQLGQVHQVRELERDQFAHLARPLVLVQNYLLWNGLSPPEIIIVNALPRSTCGAKWPSNFTQVPRLTVTSP